MITTERIREVFDLTGTDKDLTHGYADYYSDIFKDEPETLLEIGVDKGRSLWAWRELFPKCKIYGVDATSENFVEHVINKAKAEIIIGDSRNPKIKNALPDIKYDVIIDDGSHFYKDIIKTFKNFRKSFKKYYVIEDLIYDVDGVEDIIRSYGFFNIRRVESKLNTTEAGRLFATYDYLLGNIFDANAKRDLVPIKVYMLIVTNDSV